MTTATETRQRTDSEIQRDVIAELRWEPSIDAAQIGVAVKDGIVTLTGRVESYMERWAAERAAKRVTGVRAVVNEIQVKPPEEDDLSDERIAEEAVHALRWNIFVPKDKVKISVSDGWVTLEGEVKWQFQKQAAEDAVRAIPGIKAVINQIRLKPKVDPDQLKASIEQAIKRQAELEAQLIKVEVDGSKVTLRGTVRSWAERDEAERAAWSAPGITVVDNQLVVEP